MAEKSTKKTPPKSYSDVMKGSVESTGPVGAKPKNPPPEE